MVEATFFHYERIKFFYVPCKSIVFHPFSHRRALTFDNKANFQSKVALFRL